MSPEIVVNHQHCYVCNRAMPFDKDEKWCSAECKTAFDQQTKKRKQLMWFLYGAMALTLLLLFYGSVPR